MSGDQLSVIFDIMVPLDRGRSQIADLGDRPADGSDDRIRKDIRPCISPVVDRQSVEHADKLRAQDTADAAFH